MLILIVLLGWIVGWLTHWAAGYLPRLSSNYKGPAIKLALPSLPATLLALQGPRAWKTLRQRDRWFGLYVGAELLSAFMFGGLWLALGSCREMVLYTGSYSFLLLVAIIDLKYRLVLNVLIYPAALVVVLTTQSTLTLMLGGFLACGVFALTALIKPGDIGGGDVKLATLIGFAFGFPQVLWALMIGIGSGGIVAVFLLLTRRGNRQTRIAYAPFLCLGAMVALLFNPFNSLM
ncbi:MAG: prepilin peptidase [Chloroflexi bacterium]|nr:prepilin peptidase [Chloroflexota bacterium]